MMRLLVRDGDWQFRLVISNPRGDTEDPLNRVTQFVGQYRWRGITSFELTQVVTQSLMEQTSELIHVVRTVLYGMSRCSETERFFRQVRQEEGQLNQSRLEYRGAFIPEYPQFIPISQTDPPMGFPHDW